MDIHRTGASFVLILTHDEVMDTVRGGVVLAKAAPEIAPTLLPLVGIMRAMDFIGGDNGVEISGSIGSTQTLILPHASGIWGTVVHTAQEISAFVLEFTNPAVFLASIGIEWVGHTVGSEAGSIHFNEDKPRSQESFTPISTADGRVGLLSYKGYFH